MRSLKSKRKISEVSLGRTEINFEYLRQMPLLFHLLQVKPYFVTTQQESFISNSSSMKEIRHPILLIIALILFSCNKKNVEVQDPNVLATGFTIPWAIEVIGEEEFLVTERLGQLYHYQNRKLTELPNMPRVKTVSDGYLTYGGLMDVSLHPTFETNRWVYITYVGLDWSMRVARFVLQDNTVKNFRVIFESDAFSIGSRIAWQDEEHFFVSQGSGGNPYPEPGGQDLNSDVGKIHRLTAEGYIPVDNPVFDGHTQPTSIWSYGHRDQQG